MLVFHINEYSTQQPQDISGQNKLISFKILLENSFIKWQIHIAELFHYRQDIKQKEIKSKIMERMHIKYS